MTSGPTNDQLRDFFPASAGPEGPAYDPDATTVTPPVPPVPSAPPVPGPPADGTDGRANPGVGDPGLEDPGVGDPAWDDLDEDEEFRPQNSRRLTRLTAVLLAALLCAVGFFAGVQVQKLTGSSTTGAARAGADQAPGGSAGATPAVTGTVSEVKGFDVTVTDAQGTDHAVTLTQKTTVTSAYQHQLAVGDTVSVVGSTAVDGSVNATGITVR